MVVLPEMCLLIIPPFNVIIQPEAERDLDEAFEYLESQKMERQEITFATKMDNYSHSKSSLKSSSKSFKTEEVIFSSFVAKPTNLYRSFFRA